MARVGGRREGKGELTKVVMLSTGVRKKESKFESSRWSTEDREITRMKEEKDKEREGSQ